MLIVIYMMRCSGMRGRDPCDAYLTDEWDDVVQAGDEGALLEAARLLGWQIGESERWGPHYCPRCRVLAQQGE